ncbi:prepilin-type N-terminal cleavage/methylation domain-containing protein [Pseudoalteromonas sp. C2R02]|uniref:prepilin-type N-terminal cleavage/methylation domain-containing protein n=1 Tax=Pseudoalteromonas sp. C2R02 TaxID=2841565 RepID=UPI001C09B50F|nr:prepilin-type N-terminal cleavage/methylation domain-containing protein [Pseudoalteromonas sp. C2R02]
MCKNNGFILIELIISIVILSILSLTALPKFLDLNDDAKYASLNGHKAALIDSLSMLKGKHIIARELNHLDVNGYTLNFFNTHNHPATAYSWEACEDIWFALMNSDDIEIKQIYEECEFRPFKEGNFIHFHGGTGVVSIK